MKKAVFALAFTIAITPATAWIRTENTIPQPVVDEPTPTIEVHVWLTDQWREEELERERSRQAVPFRIDPMIVEDADGAELILLGEWLITEYCSCRICNGGYTGTASGAPLTPGRTVACNSLPFGAEIYIEGYGWRVVEDRGGGGACWVDICVETHEDAMSVEGSSRRKVWVKNEQNRNDKTD